MKTAQEEFDEIYISSSEICAELGVSRATIVRGRERGLLPDPIVLNKGQIQLWKRAEVRPAIDGWKLRLQGMRGATA